MWNWPVRVINFPGGVIRALAKSDTSLSLFLFLLPKKTCAAEFYGLSNIHQAAFSACCFLFFCFFPPSLSLKPAEDRVNYAEVGGVPLMVNGWR